MNTEHAKRLLTGFTAIATTLTTLAIIAGTVTEGLGMLLFYIVLSYVIGYGLEYFKIPEKLIKLYNET